MSSFHWSLIFPNVSLPTILKGKGSKVTTNNILVCGHHDTMKLMTYAYHRVASATVLKPALAYFQRVVQLK